MTPKQKERRESKHINCTLVLRTKETKPRIKVVELNGRQVALPQSIPHPVYGLYCKEHGFWFKWVNEANRQMLVNKFKVPME